jgi:hypothetical protein
MAYLFNGATHVIRRADAVVTTWPITMHGRIRLTGSLPTGAEHHIIGLFEAATNNGFSIKVEDRTGAMKAGATTKASGAASSAFSSTSISDNNWHSVIGQITGSSNRQVWLDAGGNASQLTARSPGVITKTTIGAIESGAALSGNVGHEVADVALWAGTLTADEMQALASGVSPALIRPDILEIYLPLIRGGNDQRGGVFTVTAATVADHPRVYMAS